MKCISILLGIGILFFSVSCTQPVRIDANVNQFLTRNSDTSFFALYDYANQSFLFSNLSKINDTSCIFNGLANFISAIILVESGVIFDDKKGYVLHHDSVSSLKQAFDNNNFYFFESLLQKVKTTRVNDFLLSLKLNLKHSQDTNSNFNFLYHQKISYDQVLGFLSQYYFNKIKLQKRTKSIIDSIFNHTTSHYLHPISYFIYTDKEYLKSHVLGFLRVNDKPIFFVYSSKATIKNNLNDVVQILSLINY